MVQKQSSTPNLLIQIGKAFTALLRLVFRTKPKFDRQLMFNRWQQIEALLSNNDSIYYSQAIIKADSLFDEVMKRVGASGETYADRLRSLENKFDRDVYQNLWQAHKLRNQIAHEHPKVSFDQAKRTLSDLRRGVSQLGAF